VARQTGVERHAWQGMQCFTSAGFEWAAIEAGRLGVRQLRPSSSGHATAVAHLAGGLKQW